MGERNGRFFDDVIDIVPHSPCRSMQAFSKETTSWVEDAKHAMNEELAVAEELSTWMRSQRTKEPGTTRTYTLPSFGQQPAHAAPRAGHRKDLGTVSSADAQRKSQATQPPLPLSIPKRLAWPDQTLSLESLRRLESQSMFPPRPSQLPHPPLPTAAPHVSADVAESISFEQPERPKPAVGQIVTVSLKRDATGSVSVSLKRVAPAAPAAPLEQIEKHGYELSLARVAPAAPAASLEQIEKHGYGLPHLPPETNYEQLQNLALQRRIAKMEFELAQARLSQQATLQQLAHGEQHKHQLQAQLADLTERLVVAEGDLLQGRLLTQARLRELGEGKKPGTPLTDKARQPFTKQTTRAQAVYGKLLEDKVFCMVFAGVKY